MKNLIYSISLVVISISIYLLIEYPNSGRAGLIAGGLIFIGFVLNIVGFSLNAKAILEK